MTMATEATEPDDSVYGAELSSVYWWARISNFRQFSGMSSLGLTASAGRPGQDALGTSQHRRLPLRHLQ